MIYLDVNIFVYAAIHKGKEGESSRKLLKELIEEKENFCTSTLTWDEIVYAIWKKEGKELAYKEGKEFLEIPDLKLLDTTSITIVKAQEIMEEYSLKPRDAIHAATAILNNCSEIVSDDSDFDKIKEIKRKKI